MENVDGNFTASLLQHVHLDSRFFCCCHMELSEDDVPLALIELDGKQAKGL